MRRGIVSLAAVGLLVAAVLGARSGPAASAAPAPTPVALQYDEIVRMILPPATPPPPGSFLADYQTIVGSGTQAAASTPAPARGGLAGLLDSAMGGNAAASMQRIQQGHLTRYAYYHNWIRTDDVVDQRATISKCDIHQFITLDLAHHTYTMSDTTPKSCPSQMPMMGMGGMGQQGPAQNEAPGTADMTISGTATNLGPLTIDGTPTSGTSRSLSMSTTNATGSCRNSGPMSMEMVQYVSQIVPPRPYCPIAHAVPESSADVASSSGGCKPTMHLEGTAGGFGNAGNQLVMYQRMNVQSGSGPGGVNMVTQRGNVKWLYAPQAEALFSVPPGFTQSQ